MYIKKVIVKGFKSLADFELELSPFTCLIGLNGCGKSTVLQFFDFISTLLSGDISRWFWERGWASYELKGFFSDEENLKFDVYFSDGSHWYGTYDISVGRCVQESITTSSAQIELINGLLRGTVHGNETVSNSDEPLVLQTDALEYRGSVINLIRDEKLPKSVLQLRDFFKGTHTFDAFSPHLLRSSPRRIPNSIGKRGEFLSSYFASITPKVKAEVMADLIHLFPQLHDIIVLSASGERNELAAVERYMISEPLRGSEKLIRSAHMNDGMLRILAMFVGLRTEHSFLLFDEIENGVNPEAVEVLVERLTSSQGQVLVTTHSPMILNYLDDDLARESVVFLYKGPDGATHARRFFNIPSISEKLDVMGPGEAFVDTNLVALTEELNAAVAGA